MGTSLIFGRDRIDVGVPVITYEDDPRFSFYTAPPSSRPRFHKLDPLLEAMEGNRKDKINKVVLHHDGTRNSAGCFQVLVQRNLSTHLLIDHTGAVIQVLDLYDVAYHCADANPESIGIDLNNPIRPEYTPDLGASRGLYKGQINGGPVTSLGYTEAQYESIIAVLNGLFKAIPKIKPIAPIGADGRVLKQKLEDPGGFSGVVGHQHVSASKWDPGPGFDWERVLIGTRGKRMFFPVTLPGTRNLAHVPKNRALKEAEAYCRNTETGGGGFFPVGLNQAWHTGVHLNVELDTPVYAPADGVIRVARQMDADKLGSPNMLLIEHAIKVGNEDQKTWTVISHLRKEKLGRDSAVPWIRRLFLKEDLAETLTEADGDRLPSSPGRTGLIAGRAALLEEEVKAGEIVGHSADFNPDPFGGEPLPLVDIALVSVRPLVDPRDPNFEVVEEDKDPDILCNARAVWKRFTARPDVLRGLVSGGYPLAPAEVRDFFAYDKNAEALRWLIPRHVTEWSDTTDFAGLFGGGIDFEWSARKAADRYMKRIGPYLWLDEGVRKHLKLAEDRLVYAHHPFVTLAWLSMGEARRALTPDDEGPVKGLEGRELEEARRKDRETDVAWGMELEGGAGTATDDLTGAEELEEAGEVDPEREGWMRWEPGEWDPEAE